VPPVALVWSRVCADQTVDLDRDMLALAEDRSLFGRRPGERKEKVY